MSASIIQYARGGPHADQHQRSQRQCHPQPGPPPGAAEWAHPFARGLARLLDLLSDGGSLQQSGGAAEEPFDAKFGGFQGGTFDGVRQQLDYLRALGAGAIWFTPVLKNCQFLDGQPNEDLSRLRHPEFSGDRAAFRVRSRERGGRAAPVRRRGACAKASTSSSTSCSITPAMCSPMTPDRRRPFSATPYDPCAGATTTDPRDRLDVGGPSPTRRRMRRYFPTNCAAMNSFRRQGRGNPAGRTRWATSHR